MTLPGPDDEFETYLKRRTVLPNGMSDHDKLEPPKALDASVLQEARAAIHAQQRLNRAPRWARPVALAATILLCLSILLNVSLNTNRPTENLRQMTASTAETTSATATSPAGEGERREKAADGTSSREAILPEAKVVEPRAPRPQVLAEANTPAPDDSRRAHVTAVDKATAFANGSRPHSVAPSDAAPAASSAAKKADRLADRVGIPVQAVTEAPSAANSAAYKQSQLADRSRAPTQASSEAASRADSPADTPDQLAKRSRTPAQAPAAARAQAPPSPPSAAVEAAPSPSAAASAAGSPHTQDPKTWLQHIAALRAAGKTAQADAEMLRFRAAFPTYPAKPDPSAASEPPK